MYSEVASMCVLLVFGVIVRSRQPGIESIIRVVAGIEMRCSLKSGNHGSGLA